MFKNLQVYLTMRKMKRNPNWLLMADAWVPVGAAVLVCTVLPANCVTPICLLSFPEWCQVCGSTHSSWSQTILWKSKFTIWAIWWAVDCEDCTVFLWAMTDFMSFSCQGPPHTDTVMLNLTRILAAAVRHICLIWGGRTLNLLTLIYPFPLHMLLL